MNVLKLKATILALSLQASMAVAQTKGFEPGDLLFVKGQIVGCGPSVSLVEYGEVSELGEVIIFGDITLQVRDKSTIEARSMLVDALEQKTGHRSKTVQVIRAPYSDSEKRAKMLMVFVYSQNRKCSTAEPSEVYPEWRFDFRIGSSGSHNKQLKLAAFDCPTVLRVAV